MRLVDRIALAVHGQEIAQPERGIWSPENADAELPVAETLAGIANTAFAPDGGAVDLAGSADQLARRTETQAAPLEEMAATPDEIITTTVGLSTAKADEASQLAAAAGQSAPTSDYWQGDEGKFQKSFGAGAGAIFVDDAEKDESTQTLQSQASMTISDETGKPIGAITIGINLDKL